MASTNEFGKFDKLAKEIEEQEKLEMEDGFPVPEAELLNEDTIEAIRQAKDANKAAFASYWETDENDIDSWTKVRIGQFLTTGHLVTF